MECSGRLAQLGEHHVRNVGVVGSNPMPSTNLQAIDDIETGSCDVMSYTSGKCRYLRYLHLCVLSDLPQLDRSAQLNH